MRGTRVLNPGQVCRRRENWLPKDKRDWLRKNGGPRSPRRLWQGWAQSSCHAWRNKFQARYKSKVVKSESENFLSTSSHHSEITTVYSLVCSLPGNMYNRKWHIFDKNERNACILPQFILFPLTICPGHLFSSLHQCPFCDILLYVDAQNVPSLLLVDI